MKARRFGWPHQRTYRFWVRSWKLVFYIIMSPWICEKGFRFKFSYKLYLCGFLCILSRPAMPGIAFTLLNDTSSCAGSLTLPRAEDLGYWRVLSLVVILNSSGKVEPTCLPRICSNQCLAWLIHETPPHLVTVGTNLSVEVTHSLQSVCCRWQRPSRDKHSLPVAAIFITCQS